MRAVCAKCGESITFVLDRDRFIWIHDTANRAPLYMGGSTRHHALPVKETVTVT